MSGKIFPVQLEPMGRKRKNDPKSELFSFNKGSSKKSSTWANSSGPKPKAGFLKTERSMSPNPSPGSRFRRIRSQTTSLFEIDCPIGGKRRTDFKAELFNFGALSPKRNSLSSSQTRSHNGTVASHSRKGSGINSVEKRRSTRFKAPSIFNSSGESEEENEVANEDRDDLSPGPSKSRKLEVGESLQPSKPKERGRPRTSPVKNYLSAEVVEPLQPTKSKKRSRPRTSPVNYLSAEVVEPLQPSKSKKRGRPKKQRTNTDDHTHDENMDDNNQEEDSPSQVERTREIVENGSVPQSGDDSDNDEDSVETVTFVIEQAGSDYMKLRNSDLTNNELIVPEKCTKTVAGFMSPEFRPSQHKEYPGVYGVQNSLSDSVGIGYMKIEGNTIRPPEMANDGRMIFWVLEGSIKVKSAGGHYPKRDSSGELTNYLYGKKLDQGTCIVMPKMTPFTLENWGSADAVLGFCIVKD